MPVAYTEIYPNTPTDIAIKPVAGGTNRKLAIGLGVGLEISLLLAVVSVLM
jgi:hypothetical protein